MKGKVILELEEYEELIRKNSNHIDTIIEKTNKLKDIKKNLDQLMIITKIKYIRGNVEYYIDDKVEHLISTEHSHFIKTTTILQFIKLKRGRK